MSLHTNSLVVSSLVTLGVSASTEHSLYHHRVRTTTALEMPWPGEHLCMVGRGLGSLPSWSTH